MAIKPILFNTEMVRAILDGRKTCTRRIAKGFIPDDALWGYTAFTPKDIYLVEGVCRWVRRRILQIAVSAGRYSVCPGNMAVSI